mmetsp:Transcript_34656/g.83720  ORF Transcript_34656/g.83720 Transcript_34656/m.83720 type:complete len:204 (-) Transcript_34656:298-909(-)
MKMNLSSSLFRSSNSQLPNINVCPPAMVPDALIPPGASPTISSSNSCPTCAFNVLIFAAVSNTKSNAMPVKFRSRCDEVERYGKFNPNPMYGPMNFNGARTGPNGFDPGSSVFSSSSSSQSKTAASISLLSTFCSIRRRRLRCRGCCRPIIAFPVFAVFDCVLVTEKASPVRNNSKGRRQRYEWKIVDFMLYSDDFIYLLMNE